MTKAYFTTPIYYVNDVPHIGHSYCTLATDTLARYWRKKLGNEHVFFLTGTDENSQKTLDAAQAAGKEVAPYLDEMANNWRTTWETIGIGFDDFIRTTEDRHVKTVHEIFNTIHEKGDIYKGKYVGKYCTGCETFLKDTDLDENGHCPDHKKPPKEIEEENYFFRLSAYQEPLIQLYESNPDFLRPQSRYNELLTFLKSGLEDVSISRETAEIGIPLPIDEKHKIYVWFDALINYRSGLNQRLDEFWGDAVHIIGKDITRFHAIIWPAMLMAAGIAPPKQVFAHGFFTIDGHKMSKSLGNVISPLDLAKRYGNDALRVGLLSSFEFGNDGDFSAEHFDRFYSSKLAGGVGNLFNRVVVLIHKFLEGNVPEGISPDEALLEPFQQYMEEKKLKAAIDYFFSVVDGANELLNETQVWKLAKEDLPKATDVFRQLLQKLHTLAQMSEIILPETTPKMQAMLGEGAKLGQPIILFEPV